MRAAFTHILGSTALAQLLLLASTPVLMRHHDQATFGVFGIAAAVALAGSVIISLRLDHSLHLADDPERLLGSCLQIILALSLTLAVPVMLFSITQADSTALFVLLFAGSHALWTSTLMFLNLKNRFRSIALQNLLPVIIFIVGALSAGSFESVNALLFWQAIAYGISALVGFWHVRQEVRFAPLASLLNVLGRYRDDVRYLVPARLLSIVSANMTVFGSAWLFGPELTGLVVVANRVARAPVRVLGNGMNNVLRAAIAHPAQLPATFTRIGTIAVATALLAFAVVLALPETAYARFVGDDWAGLAPVLLVATVTAGFQLLAGSVTSVLDTYAKRSNFRVNVALFAGGVATIAAAALLDLSVLAYLWIGCAASAAVHGASFFLSYGVVRTQRPASSG